MANAKLLHWHAGSAQSVIEHCGVVAKTLISSSMDLGLGPALDYVPHLARQVFYRYEPFRWSKATYDPFAEHYHLMFSDWGALIERQSATIAALIEGALGGSRDLRILDTACGIGTQTLGLAAQGYLVTGCDISTAALKRAHREAAARNLHLHLSPADMRKLTSLPESGFDVAVCLGNSVCALDSFDDLVLAFSEIQRNLRRGGLFIVGVRDYRRAMMERPLKIDPPMLRWDAGKSRTVHQLWLWTDETRYTAHVYIDAEGDHHHFSARCRAVLPQELTNALQVAGFVDISWLPEDAAALKNSVYETGFDQLMATARAPEF